MGCPCAKKTVLTIPTFKAETTTVTPSGCPEPEYLTELETILLCMSMNKYYVNSSMQEVNMLLGQIGTMRINNNYCQFDLSSFYTRLKHVECPAISV